jgi:hypothetical protein
MQLLPLLPLQHVPSLQTVPLQLVSAPIPPESSGPPESATTPVSPTPASVPASRNNPLKFCAHPLPATSVSAPKPESTPTATPKVRCIRLVCPKARPLRAGFEHLPQQHPCQGLSPEVGPRRGRPERATVRREVVISAWRMAIACRRSALFGGKGPRVRRRIVVFARRTAPFRCKGVVGCHRSALFGGKKAGAQRWIVLFGRKPATLRRKGTVVWHRSALFGGKEASLQRGIAIFARKVETVRRKGVVVWRRSALFAGKKVIGPWRSAV